MKVMFISSEGESEIKYLKQIPRINDRVPLFKFNELTPPPQKVSKVIWFPGNVIPQFKSLGLDVLIILERSIDESWLGCALKAE